MFIRRYLDEEAAGGGAAEKVADGSGESSGGDKAEGGEAKVGGDSEKSGGEAKVGGTDAKTADKKPDYDALSALHAEEKTKREKLETDLSAMKKKFDENSNLVGATRKLVEGLKSGSKTALANFAKEFGVQVPGEGGDAGADTGAIDLAKLTPENVQNDPSIFAKALQVRDAMIMKAMTDKFGAAMGAIEEMEMAKKYGDWDSLKNDREVAHLSLSTGRLNLREASHLIAIAQNMPAAIEAAKELGKQEYIAELAKKSKGAHSRAGGGAGDNAPKIKDADETATMHDSQTAKAVLDRLHGARTS